MSCRRQSGAGDERDRAGPVAVTDRFVERPISPWWPAPYRACIPSVDLVGEAWEDVEAVGTDSVCVFAGAEAASSKLEHLQDAQFALGGAVDVQGDDRVGDRELRSIGGLLAVVFADPERRRGDRGESAREVVQEASKLRLVRGERPECFEAVDHDETRLLFLQDPVDAGDDGR